MESLRRLRVVLPKLPMGWKHLDDSAGERVNPSTDVRFAAWKDERVDDAVFIDDRQPQIAGWWNFG